MSAYTRKLWNEKVLPKINEFLVDEPEGTVGDFLTKYNLKKNAYYNNKPKDWVWPNWNGRDGYIANRLSSPEKVKSKKGENFELSRITMPLPEEKPKNKPVPEPVKKAKKGKAVVVVCDIDNIGDIVGGLLK